MKKLSFLLLFAATLFLPLLSAQEVRPPALPTPPAPPSTSAADRDKPKPIKDVLPDAKKIEGLFTFYQKKDKLYAEIKGSNLNTDYLIAMAIAQGSGRTVIGGDTLQCNGSDWLWQFRKVNDNIQVVRRNIRFKADSGTPEAKAIEVGFSDSILYSLPIVATGDGGGDVIDLASIFMSDLPRLRIGFFDRGRSTWGEVKGFPNNMEFRVAATYSGTTGGASYSPDPSSVGVTLHYSISKLPSSGYSPRLADQRIGYFTVSHRNFSRAAEDNHMIRYITRWNLQKADSSATLSPPRKPIVFWIEKTVPFKYRDAVRQGILEWNKAYEKVGIVNAIEVRQQADTDTWDAEDINYNAIRWITSDRGFAKGPSRVNPLTGEILDADIIVDAGWIDYWRERFDYMIGDVLPLNPGKLDPGKYGNEPFSPRKAPPEPPRPAEDEEYQRDSLSSPCNYAQERAVHFALASLALALGDDDEEKKDKEAKEEDKSGEAKKEEKKPEEGDEEKCKEEQEKKKEEGDKEEKKNGEKNGESKKDGEEKKEEKKPSRQEKEKERNEKFEKLVFAGIKDLVTHEVGHTLGLRHNFQASSWLTLDEINDPERSKEYGHAGSVMDYLPINIAPKGKPQGDYFMSGLGPYDYLAIEYGYKILSGNTDGEKKDLAKIASRQAENGNYYATDEDLMFAASVDPRTERYDLGKDPLTFAQWGLELYNQLLPEILDRAIREDGRYKDVGRYYRLLVNQRVRQNAFLIRDLEGLYRNRDHKGDPGDRLPIQPVDAKTKREAVQFLCDNTFGAEAFAIAPEIYNRFGEEKWLEREDGVERTMATSLSDLIAQIQCNTLDDLLSLRVLNALTDTALRVPDTEDVYTIDELFSAIRASVFSELDIKEGDFTSRKPAIATQRRVLQEHYFRLLAFYAAPGSGLSYFFYRPDTNSSRSLAQQELFALESRIQAALQGGAKWDAPSAAHLTMLRDRIKRVREASMFSESP